MPGTLLKGASATCLVSARLRRRQGFALLHMSTATVGAVKVLVDGASTAGAADAVPVESAAAVAAAAARVSSRAIVLVMLTVVPFM